MKRTKVSHSHHSKIPAEISDDSDEEDVSTLISAYAISPAFARGISCTICRKQLDGDTTLPLKTKEEFETAKKYGMTAMADRRAREGELLHRVIASIPFFQNLKAECQHEIGLKMQIWSCDESHVIYKEGSKGKFFYYILTGEVALLIRDENSLDRTRMFLEQGQSFGESALRYDECRPSTVRACRKSTFLVLSKSDFAEVFTKKGGGSSKKVTVDISSRKLMHCLQNKDKERRKTSRNPCQLAHPV